MSAELDGAEIVVKPNGDISFIYSDALSAVAVGVDRVTKRASHVEPNHLGNWEADMSPFGYPVILGPFPTRAEALNAEVIFLRGVMATGLTSEHAHVLISDTTPADRSEQTGEKR